MKLLFYAILVSLAISSCISPYDFSLEDNPEFLLVDGQIYDQDSCVVRLSYTNQKYDDPVNKSIADAKVFLLENGKTIIPFEYDKTTEKYKPQDLRFRGCVDCTYQLKIILPNGKEYESTTDAIKTPDAYEKISDNFNVSKRKFEVFGELKPKEKEPRYYQTYFVNYKRAIECAECSINSDFEAEPNLPCPGRFKSCKPKDSPTNYDDRFYSVYTFECFVGRRESFNCWNFRRQRYYSIFADEILPISSPRIQRLVEIPLSSYIRYYMEIYQNHITADAYKYLKLLEDNGRKNGTLADPVPPIIFGNVHLRGDENQRTLGYFQVSGQHKYGYSVERGRIQGENLLPMDLNLEYYSTKRTARALPLPGCRFPPIADCAPNSERTNVRPLNWRD